MFDTVLCVSHVKSWSICVFCVTSVFVVGVTMSLLSSEVLKQGEGMFEMLRVLPNFFSAQTRS